MKPKRVKSLLLIVSLIILTGCWDRREIETTGMVIGIAIDLTKESSINKIQMTQQFVNTIPGKGEAPTMSYYNLTGKGNNIFEIIRKTSNRTDHPPYYNHLKVIIISDKIASFMSLPDLTNLLLRDHEIRRTIPVLFAHHNSREILETKKKMNFPH